MDERADATTRTAIAVAWALGVVVACLATSWFRRHFPPQPVDVVWNSGILTAALLARRSGPRVAVAAPLATGLALSLLPTGWLHGSLQAGVVVALAAAFAPDSGGPRRTAAMPVRLALPATMAALLAVPYAVAPFAAVAAGVATGRVGGDPTGLLRASDALAPILALPHLVAWCVAVACDRAAPPVAPAS